MWPVFDSPLLLLVAPVLAVAGATAIFVFQRRARVARDLQRFYELMQQQGGRPIEAESDARSLAWHWGPWKVSAAASLVTSYRSLHIARSAMPEDPIQRAVVTAGWNSFTLHPPPHAATEHAWSSFGGLLQAHDVAHELEAQSPGTAEAQAAATRLREPLQGMEADLDQQWQLTVFDQSDVALAQALRLRRDAMLLFGRVGSINGDERSRGITWDGPADPIWLRDASRELVHQLEEGGREANVQTLLPFADDESVPGRARACRVALLHHHPQHPDVMAAAKRWSALPCFDTRMACAIAAQQAARILELVQELTPGDESTRTTWWVGAVECLVQQAELPPASWVPNVAPHVSDIAWMTPLLTRTPDMWPDDYIRAVLAEADWLGAWWLRWMTDDAVKRLLGPLLATFAQPGSVPMPERFVAALEKHATPEHRADLLAALGQPALLRATALHKRVGAVVDRLR
jgi:hypothetical protein